MPDKYPERNYVPMYPKGHDKPPSDGAGKGNVSPSRGTDQTQGKGQNSQDYGKPGTQYPNNPSKK